MQSSPMEWLMVIDDLLARLDCVRQSSRGWTARCPAHDDHSPSLSVKEGDRGLLLKCWAGCSAEEITHALGLKISDLFFDSGKRDSGALRNAMQQRAREKAARDDLDRAHHRDTDALREADYLVQKAKGLSIDTWTEDELAIAIDSVGRAWQLLEAEDLHHG